MTEDFFQLFSVTYWKAIWRKEFWILNHNTLVLDASKVSDIFTFISKYINQLALKVAQYGDFALICLATELKENVHSYFQY